MSEISSYPLSVKNLAIGYPSRSLGRNITFKLNSGKITALMGPNGSGKSTLIKTIMGLTPAFGGGVRVFGKKIAANRKKVAYVPQRSEVDLTFPISARDMVLLGTYPKRGLFKPVNSVDKQSAMKALETVGLETLSEAQIGMLSGGQLQRVFLARALAQEADLIILDEPLTGVDHTSEAIIMRELKNLKEQGKTIFLVHHTLATATRYFDEIILFNRGLLTQGNAQDVSESEEWATVFGVAST